MRNAAHPLAEQLAERFTELRDRYDQLTVELNTYKDLLDLSPCPMMLTTLDGIVVYANKAYCMMLNVTLEQAVVYGWTKQVAENDRERVIQRWKNAVQAHESEIRDKVTFITPAGMLTVDWLARLLPVNGYAIVIIHPGCRFIDGV